MRLVFLLVVIATLADLLLIGHTEDRTQWIPVVLLALGAMVVIWTLISRSERSRACLLWLGAAYVPTGLAGVVLHLWGNLEFELEMYPDLAGWDLLAEVFTGATPALAPGSMIYLGLLALLATYRGKLVDAAPSA